MGKTQKQETWVRSLSQEDALEEEMAIHSSILAWKNSMVRGDWRLQSMEPHRAGHDWTCTPLVHSSDKYVISRNFPRIFWVF